MDYNLNLIIQGILTVSQMIFDISIVWFLIYYAIKIIRNNSRTIQIFKGVVVILIVDTLAKLLGLTTVAYISSLFVSWGFLIIVIIFQPEIRGMLEKLGKSNTFSTTSNLSVSEKEKVIDDLVNTCKALSKNNTGALISIEQNQSLNDYINTGVLLNSSLSYELLTSIFITTTPLHDGAVIIRGNKVACASAFFPPTNLSLSAKFGARHRAAIGISEVSDCITIVCSEETGEISIAHNGNLQLCNENDLKDNLMRLLYNYDIELIKSNDDDKNNNLFILEQNSIEIENKEQIKVKRKKRKSTIKDSKVTEDSSENKTEKKSLYSIFTKRKKIKKDIKPVIIEETNQDLKDEVVLIKKEEDVTVDKDLKEKINLDDNENIELSSDSKEVNDSITKVRSGRKTLIKDILNDKISDRKISSTVDTQQESNNDISDDISKLNKIEIIENSSSDINELTEDKGIDKSVQSIDVNIGDSKKDEKIEKDTSDSNGGLNDEK